MAKNIKFSIKEWQNKYLIEGGYDYKNDPEYDEDQIEQIDGADDIHPKDFKKFKGDWEGDSWAVLAKHGYEFANMDKKIGQYFESTKVGEFDNSGYGFTGSHFVYDEDSQFVVHYVAKVKGGGDPYLLVVDGGSGKTLLSAKVGQYKKIAEFIKKKYKL